MDRRRQNLLLIFVTTIIFMAIILDFGGDDYVAKKGSHSKLETLLQERAELSKLLNEESQKKAQLECKLLETYTSDTQISTDGGWCDQTVNESHYIDHKLALATSRELEGQTIGSFGDGNGKYQEIFVSTGLIPRYDSYDGAPFIDETTNGSVKYLNLAKPQYWLPTYDWILSIEVAEHISPEFESIYLDNVVRHARRGIILSWGRPGQIGVGHVNLRPDKYVITQMKQRCFERDTGMSNRIRRFAQLPWLRKNVWAYKRNGKQCPDTVR